jgi:hypothetical protein
MRTATKRKLWGRAATVSGLKICAKLLEDAAEAAGEPVADPLVGKLQEAHKQLGLIIEANQIYRMPNKRLQNMISATRQRVEAMLDMSKRLPITQEGKALKGRREGGARHANSPRRPLRG